MTEAEPRWLVELTELRLRQGNPSLRAIAEVADVSHAHVGDILEGRCFPQLDTLLAIACALGGDQNSFTRWWQDAARAPLVRAPGGPKTPVTERAILAEILIEVRGLREDLRRRTLIDLTDARSRPGSR